MKKGFTLAEVLLTLAIVGIVAALTIPALLTNTKNAQYRSAFKKMYSQLEQATRQLAYENGGSLKGVFANSDQFMNAYANYFNYTKKCTNLNSRGNCWASKMYELGGNAIDDSWYNYSALVLADKITFEFADVWSNCDNPIAGATSSFNRCGWITVDVNGMSPPNRMGMDIFQLHVLENGVKPMGAENYPNIWDCDYDPPANYGSACAVAVLMDKY